MPGNTYSLNVGYELFKYDSFHGERQHGQSGHEDADDADTRTQRLLICEKRIKEGNMR